MDDELVFRLRTDNAHKEIAEAIGCDTVVVKKVFDWLPSPYFSQPQAVKRYKARMMRMKRVTALFQEISDEFLELTPIERNSFEQRFGLDEGCFAAMSSYFSVYERTTTDVPVLRSSLGGKNWAAADIAGGVAEIYRLLERPITFGHFEGEPTTEFGRSVKAAFAAFSISANWREPARSDGRNTNL